MAAGGGGAARFLRNGAAVAGAVLLAVVVLAAALAPVLYPDSPWDLVARPFLWPGQDPRYPLGTDMLGRDLAAGMFHGARVSLLIGLSSTASALVVGVLIGAFAGYHGGWVDTVLMRVTEVFQTIPPFVFAVVVVAIFQPGIEVIVLAIALVSWPTVARLVRGEFLRLREMEFVQGCVAIGMSDVRIVLQQVLPNALSPIIVTSSVMVATAILLESALAFLGLGDPNLMSWGTMIGAGRDLLRNAWYMTAVPGTAIVLTVVALNLLGDGLNDVLNPRLRHL